MTSSIRPLSFRVGPISVSVKRPGQSVVSVAQILGCDFDEAGFVARIFLDRLVHRPSDTPPEGWGVWGAVSTVLEPPKSFQLPVDPLSDTETSA